MADAVRSYCESKEWSLCPRTILVEGTTDVKLFELASRLERKLTGVDLLGGVAVVAAGEGERGGASGVGRELLIARGVAQTELGKNGRPRYRFVGLLDNDRAGQEAVRLVHGLDASALEYKDVFLLKPWMPTDGSRDPRTLKKRIEEGNKPYAGLRWELEDLVSEDFVAAFIAEHPTAVVGKEEKGGRIHRKLTRDGKARLHRFISQHAMHQDLVGVLGVIHAMRFVLGLS